MRIIGVVSSWVGVGLVLGACTDPASGGGFGGDDGGVPPADGSMTAARDGAATTAPDGSATAAPDGAATTARDGAVTTARDGAATTDAAPEGGAAPPVSGPTIGGCPVFPADDAWNTRIDDPQKFPVHPQSATYLAHMSPTTHLHPDWGDWSTDHYGIPWQTVPAGQAPVPMTFATADESDPGPYPFPPNALVEGGSGSGGDMHVLVIDTGSCTLYETWSSTFVGPGWTCGSGAKFDLRSNALRTDGWTSADAAGLPILPGLAKVSEVQAGAILHALRFTMSSTQQAYIHPATHAAGSVDATLPPMGLRVRLKASFDLSTFSGPGKVVLTAMQQYGLILADNGSDWYVSGDSDDAWLPLMDGLIQALDQVHGSDFEAVETGPLSTAGL